MKDPNTPLTAPGLLTGKIKASDLNGYDHNKNIWNGSNGNHEDERTLLHSKDFSKIDSSYLDDYSGNSALITKTTTTTTTKKESTIKNTYAKAPTRNTTKVIDDGPVVKASIADKKSTVKMDPVKDFGSFSSLMAPALLSGKKTASEAMSESRQEQSFLDRKGSFYESSMHENNSKTAAAIIEKESTSFNLEDSLLNNNRTYSTTLNTQVKQPQGHSNGFKEESFLIRDVQSSSGGFRLERSSESKGYFGMESNSRSNSLFMDKEQPGSMMDELSKNPLFNRDQRSKSPSPDKVDSLFSKERSKSPIERNLPIRRERSKTPDRSIVKEKSPVPSKRKTPPPPVARKTSSPGRSMIPKRTPSTSEQRKTSTKQSNATSSKSSVVHQESSSVMSKSVKSKSSFSKSSSAKEASSKKGSTSPKLPSYRGMADKCRFEGETVRHFNAGKLAVFELRAPNNRRDDIQVNIISKFIERHKVRSRGG